MTPHMEAIAFRIWQVAEPKGWDLTVSEAARRAGVPPKSAIRAVKQKGWRTRFRGTVSRYDHLNARFTNSILSGGVESALFVGFDQ